jgi:hypothetical protein
VPAKYRLWFKENCNCAGSKVGCGNMGSERFGQRLAAAKAAKEAHAKAEAEAKAERDAKTKAAKEARASQRPLRLAYWKCLDSIIPGVTQPPTAGLRACEMEVVALERVCGRKVAWATCVALDKGDQEAVDDAVRRANPGRYCPTWRDRGEYGSGGQEAQALFKKYCTTWAVEDAADSARRAAEDEADRARAAAQSVNEAQLACRTLAACPRAPEVGWYVCEREALAAYATACSNIENDAICKVRGQQAPDCEVSPQPLTR